MASYDSPNYQDRTPAGPVNQSTGAPGSPSPGAGDTDSVSGLQSGTIGNSAVITPPSASLVNADRVTVDAADSLVASQVDSYGERPDPLTGITGAAGATGAGLGGNVMQGHHPNAGTQ